MLLLVTSVRHYINWKKRTGYELRGTRLHHPQAERTAAATSRSAFVIEAISITPAVPAAEVSDVIQSGAALRTRTDTQPPASPDWRNNFCSASKNHMRLQPTTFSHRMRRTVR